MKIRKSRTTRPWPITSLVYTNSKGKISFNPEYQRESVWVTSQKQLLIDSILRDIDIPKIYFRVLDKGKYDYEIVDGQQRLRAIFDYIGNGYKLSDDSDPIDNTEIAGKEYDKLPRDISEKLVRSILDIVELEGYSDDDIEETFLRLQNGTPLNAAEKRRAVPGSMRDIVGKMSKHKIFKLCGFSNKRYAYEDAISKILHISLHGSITDIRPDSIKKTYVINKNIKETDKRIASINSSLTFVNDAFKGKQSPKFKKFSIITLIYLVQDLQSNYSLSTQKDNLAKAYLKFEKLRAENNELDQAKRDPAFAAYSDAARSDSVANMEYRHDLLKKFLIAELPQLEAKDKNRIFNQEQKTAIYFRDKGVCKICKKKCDESDFHADHIKSHVKGGKTILANSQLLCSKCNLKKGSK